MVRQERKMIIVTVTHLGRRLWRDLVHICKIASRSKLSQLEWYQTRKKELCKKLKQKEYEHVSTKAMKEHRQTRSSIRSMASDITEGVSNNRTIDSKEFDVSVMLCHRSYKIYRLKHKYIDLIFNKFIFDK